MPFRRKSAPYSGTEIPPEKSKVQIEKLLRDYGCDGVQWSELWKQNRAQITFVLQNPQGRSIMVRLEPPPFSSKRRTWVPETGHYEQVDAPNWAQSYRLLYAYLKAKLEAIAYGLRDIEEEFLADTVVRDQHGQERRVAEVYQEQLASGELRPALGPGGPIPAEASKKRDAIDVEGRSA